MTYQKAIETLGKRESKKICNNTYLEKREDSIAIRLHNTDILTFCQDGKIILNTDGWKTATTKDRFNRYLEGFNVIQENSVWYLIDMTNSDRYIYEDDTAICGKNNNNLK